MFKTFNTVEKSFCPKAPRDFPLIKDDILLPTPR